MIHIGGEAAKCQNVRRVVPRRLRCSGSHLRLLEQEDELRATRLVAAQAQVQGGIDQAERGELVDGEAAVGRVKERAAAKRRNADG